MLKKMVLYYLLVSPFWCLAQSRITGRVISATGKTGIANASVFLSNATVGTKTTPEGGFTLSDAKNGKYELVVSIVGFETYKQMITVTGGDMVLPDITMSPKTYALKEVVVKQRTDPNLAQYLPTFKEQFLGKSELADQCKILNPEMLDFAYDDDTKTLTASSVDFLIIENQGLGYRIKYLIKNFTYSDKNQSARKLHYEGSVLFEELNGSPSQKRDWRRARLQVYKGSATHFLRALQNGRLDDEGFRVLQIINPKHAGKLRLKTGPVLLNFPLKEDEMMKNTDQANVYALGCDFDSFHITYNQDHHFSKRGQVNNLDAADNREVTILDFNTAYALFDSNGALLDPNSVTYRGAWSHHRVAELLPVDYDPLNGAALANNSSFASGLASKLKIYNDTHVTEKAYLHFDKPYYAAGDTIYFKAYITAGERHELSDLSGVLYAELINPLGKVQQAMALQLTDGISWGDFALPDTLLKGNYSVMAYTTWMRNENNFFTRDITVGSLGSDKVPESAIKQTPLSDKKTDVQFFAEGGSLVSGYTNKIAFKATAPNGRGIGVKGVVVDDDGKQLVSFASAHLGMGYFMLRAQPGKNYQAIITDSIGYKQRVALPSIVKKGIGLSVNNSDVAKASVKIAANDAFYQENKGRNFALVIYSGGTAVTVDCKLDSQAIALDILKRRLKTGITRLTLFNDHNEPLGERLFFVQNYDQLSFDLKTDKINYRRREKTDLSLNIKNRAGLPATGHFSVAVTDEAKVPADENEEHTILTNLLLTSDLKGTVEQPNYYFANVNEETQRNLDLVMLTNGYRRFEWRSVLNNLNAPPAFQPEKGLTISGNVKTNGGKKLNGGTVSLIPSDSTGTLLSQPIGSDGSFKFTDLLFTDSGRFVLQAVNAKGDNTTVLTYNKNEGRGVSPLTNEQTDINSSMVIYLENKRLQHDDYLKYNKVKMLKEVKIKAVKINDYRSSALGGPGNANQVIHLGQLPVTGSLTQMVESKVHGAQAYAMLKGDFDGLVILDGMAIDKTISEASLPGGSRLDFINASDVETVEFFYGPNAAIYGARGGHGVIVITSKARGGLSAKDISSTGILPVTVPGFYKARVFYSPKYENLEQTGNRPDLRSTIYWQPELMTDKNGQALFNYCNADGTGSYRIVIEGIDEDGNLGRLVYRYNVQ